MFYKIHDSKAGKVLAVADEDVVGKHFKLKEVDFFVNPRFYGEQRAGKTWLIEKMKSPEIISVNLFGEEAVATGIEAGIVDKDKIIKICKVPHAQSFLIF